MLEVSVTEAAEIKGVSRMAIVKAIQAGKLVARKVGSTWVIPRKSLEAYETHGKMSSP